MWEAAKSSRSLSWAARSAASAFLASALPVFIAAYLRVWGRVKWWIALLYAGLGWAFLFIMFDRVIAVMWYPSLLFF